MKKMCSLFADIQIHLNTAYFLFQTLLSSCPIHTKIPQQYKISTTASVIKSHKNVRIETSLQCDATPRPK